VQSIEKTTRTAQNTAQEITNSQRRAFEALTDNVLSFQRRNARVAQGFTGVLKLQGSNAKAAQDLFTSGLKFAELQQRNVRFAQEWMGYGANFLREQAESNARTAEVVAQSASEQQESFQKLAEQLGSTYEGLFSSWDRYAKENLRRAQQVTEQVAERGIEAAEQVSRQGLRVAEDAAEQTERAARKADPNDLPIKDYDKLTVSEISSKLDGLTVADLRKVEAYEKRNKNRETVIEQIERKTKAAS
jgi:hypothetical protein